VSTCSSSTSLTRRSKNSFVTGSCAESAIAFANPEASSNCPAWAITRVASSAVIGGASGSAAASRRLWAAFG